MESLKWQRIERERDVMEAVLLQVKGACDKFKEKTNSQEEHIRKVFIRIRIRY